MEQKFKVGDRVRVIDHRPRDAEKCYWNSCMNACLGKEGVIKSINGSIRVEFPGGVFWWYKPSWLTLVESDDKRAQTRYERIQTGGGENASLFRPGLRRS